MIAIENGIDFERREVLDKVGLKYGEALWISLEPTWEKVPVGLMRKFITACGLDFGNAALMRRYSRFLRNRPTWANARKHPLFPRLVEPIIQRARSTS